MENRPLISVITVAYNNKFGLEETIKSVVSQTFKDIEFIVIDGGSTDGSKELLESYSSQINFWI
ncbi:MAG: glycosyltransferase, partial [Chryseobacterium sp.]|nr:glycosyltransferase [Chryseobacterium sp.]